MQYCLDGLIEKLGEMARILTEAQDPGKDHVLALWGHDEIAALGEAKERLEQVDQWRSKKIAELEQELVKTKQYLAVAEGLAYGGPPGWEMSTKLVASHGLNKWILRTDDQWLVCIEQRASIGWCWWVYLACKAEFKGKGESPTAREAIAAAEAAYQEAIND